MLIEYISVIYCLLQLLDWWKHCVFHHLTAKSFFHLKTCVSLCWSNLITLTFLKVHGLNSMFWLAQNFIISIKTHLLNPFALLQGILFQIQLFELILNKMPILSSLYFLVWGANKSDVSDLEFHILILLFSFWLNTQFSNPILTKIRPYKGEQSFRVL